MRKIIIALYIVVASSVYSQKTSRNPAVLTPKAKRARIDIGHAKQRRVNLAVDYTQNINHNFNTMGQSFTKTLKQNLYYSGYFNIMSVKSQPKNRGGFEKVSINFNAYKKKRAEFIVKSQIQLVNRRFQANVRFYEVHSKKTLLKKSYPLTSKSSRVGRILGTAVADEIVKAISGMRGVSNTRIIMSCGRRTKEIYSIDFDGSNLRKLSNDRNLALAPSWNRDATKFIYTSFRPYRRGRVTNPNLYMVDVPKRKRWLIAGDLGLNTGGVFSPVDENNIAYTYSSKGRPEIYVLDLEAKRKKKITKTRFFTVEPTWSPDGKRLSYSSSRTGRPHIYVANANGSASRRITYAGKYNSSPDWSPRGDKIVFASQVPKRGNLFNLYTISPHGGDLQKISTGLGSSENPSYSPDGRYITYASNKSGRYRIYVMNEFGQFVRPLSPKRLGECKDPDWSGWLF